MTAALTAFAGNVADRVQRKRVPLGSVLVRGVGTAFGARRAERMVPDQPVVGQIAAAWATP